MKTICIIPARGGSQRVPRKNVREFRGKPIICYSIDAAHASNLFDVVVVSTEDHEIAELSSQVGADLVVYRPQSLSIDQVGTQEVARHVLKSLTCEHACVLYATAPLMNVDDLRVGYETLKKNGDIDYAFSVNKDPIFDAGQFYWGKHDAFYSGRPLIGGKTVIIPIDPNRVCDINTEEDWSKAETMYDNLLKASK